MSRPGVNSEVMSFLEEVLGKDWENQLKEEATMSPTSLKRTVLCSIALQGLDYSRLPKSLASEVVEVEGELRSAFPDDFYHNFFQVGPSLGMHMAFSASWAPGGVWTLTKCIRPIQLTIPFANVEPNLEMDMDKLVLQPNVEVTQSDLAPFLLLPPTTELYDSTPEVTVTKVDFDLARKSLQLKGICLGNNGERLFLKTIIQAKVFEDDLHLTTMLYKREEQVEASFITSAVFLPTLGEAVDRLFDEESLEDGSSDEDFSFDFTSAASRNGQGEFAVDDTTDRESSCQEDDDCHCTNCLNNLTFGNDDDEEEEEGGMNAF